MSKDVASALRDTLISPNVGDSNFEPANVVDAIALLARSVSFGLKHLGNGDAASVADAIEHHAVSVREAAEKIAWAIREHNGVSDPLEGKP